MGTFRIFRRLQDQLDVDPNGLPQSGVPRYHTDVSSFVVETIGGGAGGDFSAGISNLGNTLGQTGVTGTRLVLAGIGNLTLSQLTDANGGTVSISGGTAAAGAFSAGVSGGNTAGDTGATGTRLVFAGGNSITLSQANDGNGGTITISGPTQSVQPETQTFVGGISASDTLYTSGTVRFTGSNIVTVRSGTGQLVIVDASTSQSVQTQNMVAVTLSGNTSGAQALISSGTMTLAGGNNITVSQNGNAVTISGPNVGGAQTGISGIVASDATYTSGTVTFTGSGDITVLSGTGQRVIISGSQSVQTQGQMSAGVSTGGNTAGDTGVTGTRLVFVGSNNITLSQATAAAGGTVTISGPTTVAQSNQTLGMYALGNTTGQSSSTTFDARTVSIRGDGIVSVGYSNGSLRISASQSVQPETQTFVGGIAASNTTYTSGTITFTGVGGGVTVSSNTGQRVDISVAAPVAQTGTQFSAGISNIGNTAGDTGTVAGRLVLAGGNNITLSGSTNGVSETVTISGPNTNPSFSAGVSNLGNTAGDTGVTGTRLVLVGSNNMTLSQATGAAGATVTMNAAGGGAGQFSAGVSNLGNTAGNTGITGTQLVLVGSGIMSLSQTTGANGATVTISAPATSSLVGTSGISLSTNGSTISIMQDPAPLTVKHWFPHPPLASSNQSFANASMFVYPFHVPDGMLVTATRHVIHMSASISTTNANTLSGSISISTGIYSLTGSTLSLASSGSQSYSWSQSSNQNSSIYSGLKEFSIPMDVSITQGEWWGAYWIRTSAGSGTISLSVLHAGSGSTNPNSGPFGSTSNSSYNIYPGFGQYSNNTTSGAMVGSIDMSVIKGGMPAAMRIPYVYMANDNVGKP